MLGVYISAVKTIRTKKGEVMAFLTVSDEEGDIDAVVFPNVIETSSQRFRQGQLS